MHAKVKFQATKAFKEPKDYCHEYLASNTKEMRNEYYWKIIHKNWSCLQ